MNRSYSKLRHIQEANILLEKRLMNEKSKPLNESYEDWNSTGERIHKDSKSDWPQHDDDDFGFESPFCPKCNGNGCKECSGSGMKRNPVTKEKDVDESYWSNIFGDPSIKDAAHDSLRGKGYSHTGKDDSGEEYTMHDNEKFHPHQLKHADYDDMGDIPRVHVDDETGERKLIVANPAWSL